MSESKGQVENLLQELGKKIDEMVEEVKEVKDDLRDEFEEKIDDLKERKQKLQSDFEEFKSQDKWQETKDHFSKALDELKLAIKTAMSQS